MSVVEPLLCAVEGHDVSIMIDGLEFFYHVPNYDAARVRTVQDLFTCIDMVHTACPCRQKLLPALWLVNLAWGQEANSALAWYQADDKQLLDGRAKLDDVFPRGPLDVPPRTIHLMVRTEQPLKHTSGPLTMGLRRLDGDLCVVLPEVLRFRRLPDTSDFAQIVATSGCFYIDRFDWINDHYGGTDPLERLRIPIVRRGAGFGKSTFLSSFAAQFDAAIDQEFMPRRRTLTAEFPPQMVVFHLDFGLLRLRQDMSDDEVCEECTRVMRHATQLFLQKYAAFFEVDVPSYSDKFPYGAVRAFALARKREIFLAIDNYTTPFLDMRIKVYCRDDSIIAFRRLEDAIYAHMLAHIFVDASTGLVKRGFITGLLQPGEELGSPVPFADYAPIEVRTEDLTYSLSSISSGIVGFTKSDVTELVRSFLCVGESAIPGVVNAIIDKQHCNKDTTLFAPRNIIEALREYAADVANVASPTRSEDSMLLQHSFAALKL